jgi:hypothetical protein
MGLWGLGGQVVKTIAYHLFPTLERRSTGPALMVKIASTAAVARVWSVL